MAEGARRSIWAHDLHRDLAEKLAVPRAEDLVARAPTDNADHDQRSVDLVTGGKLPAFFGGLGRRDYLCHSLTLRPTDGCTTCASTQERGLPVREPSSLSVRWLLLP